MCEPLSLAFAAASAGASAIGQSVQNNEMQANQIRQMQNQAQIRDAQNRELDESRARQKVFSDRNQQTLQDTLQRFQPDQQQAQQQQAQTDATQQFQKAITPADGAYKPAGGSSAPAIVQNTYDTVTKDANTRGMGRAASLGALDGYKSSLLSNNTYLKNAGNQIDTQNGFSQSEGSLLPSYQDFAQSAVERPNGGAKPLSGVGSTLTGLGNLGAAAAGSGKLGNWFASLDPLPNHFV